MTGRILSGALIAGLVAGLLAAALSLALLVPLILDAEAFEVAGHAHAGDVEPHAHAAEASPLRHLGTVALTVAAHAGFALVLGAGMALAARLGHRLDARTGALWGLAGFAAIHLAPAAGLPPELPGAATADLGARQAWWALCAGSTAAGLAALAFGRSWAALAAGLGLVLLPHLVGAPLPPSHDGLAPPGLAAAFVFRSLAVACLVWVALGALAGALAGPRARAAAA